MKIAISLRPLNTASKTRGIGVYTKLLLESLTKIYASDNFIPSTKDYYNKSIDVVHFPFFDPFFLTLPLRKPKPTVVTVHDLIPVKFAKHFKVGIRGKLKWQIQKRSLLSATHIITDSKSSKSDIHKITGIPEDKITVVPLAPSIEYATIPAKLKKTVIKEYKLPEKFVLYVGDVNWNKNIPGLIDEFSHIKNSRHDLVLVGKAFTEKPETPELRLIKNKIEDSGVKDRIHLIGYIPTHHLPVLYSLAACYVQPSFYEGFGLTVLEAMQHHCPVISSNRGSLKEVGGDSVLYFDPGKKGDLTSAINKLLSSSSLRESLTQKGLKRVKKYSWEQAAKSTMKIYEAAFNYHSS